MSSNIESRIENKVLFIEIKDGPNGNRVSDEMAKELTTIMASIDATSKAIVLTTEGKDFCLGRAVMGEAPGRLPEAYVMREKFDVIFAFYDALRSAKVPIIARVQGMAAGFGCAMASLCDITIASNASQFQLPETSHGIMPTMAMSSLIDRVNRKAITYMTYSSDLIDAQHALAVGIVSLVVPDQELDQSIDHIVSKIRNIPLPAVHAVKEFATFSIGQPIPTAIQYARNLHATINSSEQMRE